MDLPLPQLDTIVGNLTAAWAIFQDGYDIPGHREFPTLGEAQEAWTELRGLEGLRDGGSPTFRWRFATPWEPVPTAVIEERPRHGLDSFDELVLHSEQDVIMHAEYRVTIEDEVGRFHHRSVVLQVIEEAEGAASAERRFVTAYQPR